MSRRFLLLLASCGVLLAGCVTGRQPAAHQQTTPCHGLLKRVTQLDLNDNHPLKSWSACAESIHQHSSPPIGIAFTDAETGRDVKFEGTYRIETYKAGNYTPNE